MKIKNIIPVFVAIIAMMVSCSDEFEPTYLDEIKVSSSMLAIPQNGGSATVEFTTNGEWELVCCDTCEVFNRNHMAKGASKITEAEKWLNALQISATKGEAGTSKITFTSDATLDGRSHDFKIHSCGVTQIVTVMQGLATVSNATCADVIAGPDSKTYRVTGICTGIYNTQYGNWFLNDGTGEITIYGTLYDGKEQNKPIENLKLEVGDEVTVEGPKTTYGSTIELVNVTVISVNKSLIKIDTVDPENGTLSTDGGDFTVNLINKGQGVSVEVPEDAKSWLSLKSVNGNTVVFHAAENNAGPRATTLTFNTTDGKKSYSCETTLSQEGKAGTLDLPMTVAEAIAAANAGVTTPVYVKGIVSELVSGGYGAKYGNGTFWISADGTKADDLALDFEVYRATWFGNEKWTDNNAQLAVGAEVVIYGVLTLYNGIAETKEGAAYVYSVNGVTTDANGIGTQDAPFAPAGACNAAFAGCTNNVYVAGKVAKFPKDSDKFNAQYGNASFWMSADGSYTENKAVEFEAYRVLYLGNRKWAEGDKELKEGDDVVIYGPLTTYNGTAETEGNKGYLISINGATE